MNTPSTSPTHSQIQERARTLWLAAGAPVGRDVEFWLAAERQLQAERMIDSPGFRTGVSPERTADEIDPAELAERLDDFGEAPRRSPTSIKPSS